MFSKSAACLLATSGMRRACTLSVRSFSLNNTAACPTTTLRRRNDRHQSTHAAAAADGDSGSVDATASAAATVSGDTEELSRRDYRFIFPEFLPDPKVEWRNSLREKLERKDMLQRRNAFEIPEFYVGSSMAVTAADSNSPHPNKTSRFVGLCIDRGGTGLRAWFILRNVVEGQGVEVMYQMYNPSLIKIEVLRLERRLDEELYYLRDAPAEYSTVPFDMEAEILPDGARVPVNEIVVPLNAQPWTQRWERYTDLLHGYTPTDPFSTPCKVREQMRWMADGNEGWQLQTMKYDLMREYRHTIPVEEQDEIWTEVADQLELRDKQMRRVAAKRAFVRPTKKV